MRIPTKRQGMRDKLVLLIAAAGLAFLHSPAAAARRPPVVVELFTAQGCSACARTNDVLDAFVDRRGLIALTFPVDYWDYLGWRDTFAQPGFTDRQRAYADRLKVKEIYTPEVVVDGRRESPGVDRERVDALIARAPDGREDAPTIRFLDHGARVQIGGTPAFAHAGALPRGAEVWLARYDPAPHEVRVKAGENKGKLMSVRNVVRELVRLGSWSGRRRTYALPEAKDDGLKAVILVQGSKGGRILAAAKAAGLSN